MEIFNALESEVRGYCRAFPVVFSAAVGSRLYDEAGKGYVDFFSGAGALNYGHDNPRSKSIGGYGLPMALTLLKPDLEEGLAIIADSVPVALERIGGRAEARLAGAVSL
jgi:4-aminobutyrate aminotransferase-like enzyme